MHYNMILWNVSTYVLSIISSASSGNIYSPVQFLIPIFLVAPTPLFS